ncbi:MAG: hypothetical protein WAM26_20285, partial [Nitrososphaeraceae archaeon]
MPSTTFSRNLTIESYRTLDVKIFIKYCSGTVLVLSRTTSFSTYVLIAITLGALGLQVVPLNEIHATVAGGGAAAAAAAA